MQQRSQKEREITIKRVLPPTYFLACLLLVMGIPALVPAIRFNHGISRLCGALFLAFGIMINIWTDNLFKAHKTTVKPFENSSSFIEEGPFRFTRNPMYLGMVCILLGIALLLGSALSLGIACVFAVLMDRVFIGAEEALLEKTFGQEFIDYKKRVRRWV